VIVLWMFAYCLDGAAFELFYFATDDSGYARGIAVDREAEWHLPESSSW
jgi:hypothetical protein